MNCHEKTLLKKIATFKNGKKRPDSIGNIPVYLPMSLTVR